MNSDTGTQPSLDVSGAVGPMRLFKAMVEVCNLGISRESFCGIFQFSAVGTRTFVVLCT